MRLIAFSLNRPTPAFTAALAALRSLSHTVDFYTRRSIAESVQGYHGLVLSLGDVGHKDAQPVKLAAMKAACELPVCLFLDRPLDQVVGSTAQPLSPESFWASSVVGETTSDRVHRGEMLAALKGEWRIRIEDKLDQWVPHAIRGITPAFDFLKLPDAWEPTTFHFTPAIVTKKSIPRLDVRVDSVSLQEIAMSNVVYRHRSEDREERWSPLPIDCVRLKTIYLDERPFHDVEDGSWLNGRLPGQTILNQRLDEQIAAFLGVKKLTPGESARKLEGLLKEELRAAKR